MINNPCASFLVVLLLAMLGGRPAAAAEHFQQCLKHDAKDCFFFFSTQNDAAVRDAPGQEAAIRWRAGTGMALRIDWARTRSRHENGWAYIDNGYEEKGWIQSAALVGYGDFRKVSKCWPIKVLEDDNELAGDFMFSAVFTENGAGRLTSEGGALVHAWYAPNLVLLRKNKKLSGYVYAFDRATNTVKHPLHGYTLRRTLVSGRAGTCSSGFGVQ
ncbi:hypothetical protein [Pseudoduganella violacea]|uniref:SH3 domain-containing protein n=1 Tax=Pseudoduganella violacea TaxID=1715466 RepID=A0A7W5BAU0_9BURK|nr:hypothetical protein [Pseudoduganella violacea]MBB3119713.1 hypothetical protein [Pseudoduganella violacea]